MFAIAFIAAPLAARQQGGEPAPADPMGQNGGSALLPAPAPASPAAPSFNIKQSCAAASDPAICERFERNARTALGDAWDRLPAVDRATCEARAEEAGGSYVTALSCARGRRAR